MNGIRPEHLMKIYCSEVEKKNEFPRALPVPNHRYEQMCLIKTERDTSEYKDITTWMICQLLRMK